MPVDTSETFGPSPALNAGDRVTVDGRDRSIDVIRGLCLVSMTTGHLLSAVGGTSVIVTAIHSPVVVDGAHGFVFLSGVSIALADAARRRRGATRWERAHWITTRAAWLVVLHVLVSLAIQVSIRGGSSSNELPSWIGASAPGDGWVWHTLSMQQLISNADVLPLYAVFLAVTSVAVLADRVSDLGLLALSIMVYAWSQLWPEPTAVYSGANPDPSWILGSWQLIFFLGFVAGRRWSSIRHAMVGPHRWAAITLAVGTVGLLVVTRGMLAIGDVTAIDAEWLRTVFDETARAKRSLPPLQLVLAIGLGVALHLLLTVLFERIPATLTPLEQIGRHSLRIYLGSCLGLIAAWQLVGPDPGALEAELLALVGLAGCWLLARPRGVGRGRPWAI